MLYSKCSWRGPRRDRREKTTAVRPTRGGLRSCCRLVRETTKTERGHTPRSNSRQPKVTIEPRTRPSKEVREDEGKEPSIRVETTLVLINVTVTDPMNRFVTGLEKEHFTLFEDKSSQTIAQFSSEDAPLSVGLVFDASGSMGSKLTEVASGGCGAVQDREPGGRILPDPFQ